MTAATLRELLARGTCLTVPTCYDALSARIVREAGFPATFMSGFGVAAARLGYKTHIYEPAANPPAGDVAHQVTTASYEDHAALAGFAMVKFYGIVFLGQPREHALHDAHDAGWLERIGLLWLAAGCLALGLLPAQIVPMLAAVATDLGIDASATLTTAGSWWLLAPLPERGVTYAPLAFLLAVFAAVAVVSLVHSRRSR